MTFDNSSAVDIHSQDFRKDFRQHLQDYKKGCFGNESFIPSPSVVGALPPSCLEVEEAVLGILLQEPHRMLDLLEVPNDIFFSGTHRFIFQLLKYFILRYGDKFKKPETLEDQSQQAIAFLFLLDDLVKTYDLDVEVPFRYIKDLFVCHMEDSVVDARLKILLDKYYRRKMIRSFQELCDQCYDPTRSIEDIIAHGQNSLELVSAGLSHTEGFADMSTTLKSIYETYQKATEGQMEVYTPTGLYDLDEQLGGGYLPGYHILAARTSMGKSALALAFAHAVAKQGGTVAYYSLEMPKEALGRRLMSAESKIPTEQMIKGDIPEERIGDFYATMSDASLLPLLINDQSSLTCGELRSTLRDLHKARKNTAHPLKMAIIDHIGLMDGIGGPRQDKRALLGDISREIHRLSRELAIPIVVLAQINRGPESRNDKRPMLSDLRESGALEQDADSVSILYRDEYYNPDTADRGILEVNIAKMREGRVGTVKLGYDLQFSKIYSLARRS